MIRRIAVTLGLGALLLATVAWTQMEIRGVVSYVDPTTRTVHFTDGRMVQIHPGATLTINGQPVVLEAVRPGATAVLLPPGTSTTTVTTVTPPTHVLVPPPPPVAVAPPVAAPSHAVTIGAPPVNVTGTIAHADPLNQTITFQDGRIVRIAPNTMVWQQSPAISTLEPGARVFVRDAMPVGYLPTVVHVDPNAMLRSGDAAVAMSQLRPGDEILIKVTNPARASAPPPAVSVVTTPVPATADRYVGSALPYQGYTDTRIEAADVQIIGSP